MNGTFNRIFDHVIYVLEKEQNLDSSVLLASSDGPSAEFKNRFEAIEVWMKTQEESSPAEYLYSKKAEENGKIIHFLLYHH
jgi:hypothetical protein